MWTKLHFYTILPTFIVLIGLAALVAWLLKNKSERARNLPFQILAVGLLILELIKQVKSFDANGYNRYSLPFHFCSLFLYAYPLHAFYKGKYKHVSDTIAFSCGAALFFFMLVMPTVVYSDGNIRNYFKTYGDFHTVTFHAYACFYFFLMVAMKAIKFDTKRDVKVISCFFAGYVVVATAMSYIVGENFHNLRRCNLQAGEDIRLAIVNNIGWIGQALYTVVLFILTILFALIAYFTVKGLLWLGQKAWSKIKKAS